MLIRASSRPARSLQPALPSRHGVKHPPPGGPSSCPPAPHAGDRLAHPPAPAWCWQGTAAQGHHPAPPALGSPGGKTGGQVRELATSPEPPATAASELTGIPAAQQVFYWVGLENLRKRQNRSRQASSGEVEEARHAAPAPGEHSSISSPHLLRSRVRQRAHREPGQCPVTAQESCRRVLG